jgi:hypothetical protein
MSTEFKIIYITHKLKRLIMVICETTVHPMDGMFELPRMGLQRVDE